MKIDLKIFVATVPNENKVVPYLTELEQQPNYIVLHPFYDFNTAKGKEILKQLKMPVPNFSNQWDNWYQTDVACIKCSDILLYDSDCSEQFHMLTIASLLKVPVVAVSQTLNTISPYFSGIVTQVVKPHQLKELLTYFSKKKDCLSEK